MKQERKRQREAAEPVVEEESEEINEETLSKLTAFFEEYNADTEDSSEDADVQNTIGNVPLEWYKEEDHVGYDINGNKIIRQSQGDEVEKFLDQQDNPNFWRSYYDEYNGKEVVVSKEDIEMIRRIKSGHFAGDITVDPLETFVTIDREEDKIFAVTQSDKPKSKFVPSKWEEKRVQYLVRAIKNGWLKSHSEKMKERNENRPPEFHLLWDEEGDAPIRRITNHIPARPMPLPGHAESYNPPEEYLFNEDEEKEWDEGDASTRKMDFKPHKYSSMRVIPQYENYILERYQRCLDLFMVPRKKNKYAGLNMKSSELLPELPKLSDLKPFPSKTLIHYPHDRVRCISVCPRGLWLAMGDKAGTIAIYDVMSARCVVSYHVGSRVHSIQWNPVATIPILLAGLDDGKIVLLTPGLGSSFELQKARELLDPSIPAKEGDYQDIWQQGTPASGLDEAVQVYLQLENAVKVVRWHAKGDYFASISPGTKNLSVLVHRLSTKFTQSPFKKGKGTIFDIHFHPSEPKIFLSTTLLIYVYHLKEGVLVKKIKPGTRYISSMAIHPSGDHILVGGFDSVVQWVDLDYEATACQSLRIHKESIRDVQYHRKYPISCSTSQDGTVFIIHAHIASNLYDLPKITPVKKLLPPPSFGSARRAIFHPTCPWLFVAYKDHVQLFCSH